MLVSVLSIAVSLLQVTSPEAEPSVAYVRAIECAAAYTDSASLDEDTTGRVTNEAVTHCEALKRAAINGLMTAIAGTTEVQATQLIESKMRIVAHERIIVRLERGDFTFRGRPNDSQNSQGLYGPAVRYLLCIRAAIDQTVDSGYVGDTWFSDTLGKGKREAAVALSQLGESSCPASSTAYNLAFEAAKNANLDIVDFIQRAWEPSVILSLATKPYSDLAPRP